MTDDVHTWLRALGLEQYSDAFAANDIDLRVLPHLTDADLRELGLSLGHRKILMAAVAEPFGPASPPTSIIATSAKHQPDLHIASSERPPERRLLSVLFCDLGVASETPLRPGPRGDDGVGESVFAAAVSRTPLGPRPRENAPSLPSSPRTRRGDDNQRRDQCRTRGTDSVNSGIGASNCVPSAATI